MLWLTKLIQLNSFIHVFSSLGRYESLQSLSKESVLLLGCDEYSDAGDEVVFSQFMEPFQE